MNAYYNEIDPNAAQWLRNLIDAGHIAPGFVDERSIEDVRPDELMGYTQCHFFAGIGVWSYALRLAGISDDTPLWTGSCPCQPFSSAGKGDGFADERHLWPHWYWLIEQCRPPVVFGEQVASKAVEPWIDLVHADLEALDYAFGCVPFPSAGVGAPHIRDRTFWVGHSNNAGLEGHARNGRSEGRKGSSGSVAPAGIPSGLGDTCGATGQWNTRGIPGKKAEEHRARVENWRCADGFEHAGPGLGRMADLHGNGCDQAGQRVRPAGSDGLVGNRGAAEGEPPTGPVNGFWRDADWLFCRDGKWRAVEPGTFPLAHGVTNRVGRLRAYGNAINAQATKVFIDVAMQFLP